MCEFNGENDISIDVADVSVDVNDSDFSSENIDIDDISEDIDDSFSDMDTEASMEIEDLEEDVSEGIEINDDICDDVYELEEDIDDSFSDMDTEASMEIEDLEEDVFEEIEINDDIYELEEETKESLEKIQQNGYEYTLDEDGRVSEVEGDLRLETGERNSSAQIAAGGEFRRDTDDGGHFIGNRFNGPGGEINMFAQNSNLNRGGYKSMENEWARELEKGNDVHVKIDPIYQDGTERPHAIMGEYTITNNNNTPSKEYFSFTNENLRSEEFNIDDYDFEFPEEKESK